MKSFKGPKRVFALIAGLGLLLGGLITACGSDSPGGANQAGPVGDAGTVVLLLTDGPTEDFSEVSVTVNEVTLLSDDQPPVILSSQGRQVDLLALQGVEDLFMIHEGVPAGLYQKIRLRVSNTKLVRLDGTVIDPSQILLVGAGEVELVLNQPFQVSPGETLVIQLDLDLAKAIQVHVSDSNEPIYEFRPVVFVTLLIEPHARLVHVGGEIVSIDEANQSFLLRHPHRIRHIDLDDTQGSGVSDSQPAQVEKPNLDGTDVDDAHDDRRHLIRVVVSEETHFFDEKGQPGGFASLDIGQHVRVRGLLSAEGGLHIEARLIEIGRFIGLHGSITREVDEKNQFGFHPDPGQGINADVILVQVSDETLIFEAGTHRRLTPVDLVTGKRVLIEGVLELRESEPDIFHAGVIIVRPPEPNPTRLEGTIFDPDPVTRTLDLNRTCPPGLVCPAVLLPVHVMDEAVIIRIRHGEGGHLIVELIPFEALKDGNKVTLFGRFGDAGTFHALVVVVEATFAVLPPQPPGPPIEPLPPDQ